MSNPNTSTSSFLKEAFLSYSPSTSAAKQEIQKQALQWLQTEIETKLKEQKVLENFTEKWRSPRKGQSTTVTDSALYLDNLPRSYKGSQSINNHQEEALIFIHEQIPSGMQEEFKKRWNLKKQIRVVSNEGAAFKIEQKEAEVLQQEDPNGQGLTWYKVEKNQAYYLVDYQEQDQDYLVVLNQKISPQNQDTWYVSKEDVKISDAS